MSEKTDLVPLEKTNIENAAAVSGGIVGLAIGGPVFGIILAAVSNYVSKKEDSDYGSALRGFGKTVIESYNFLTTLNNKNDITGSASSSFDKFITNAEIESEGFGKFTKASDNFVSKVKDFNAEYDLLGKGKQAIIAGSALTDAALERIEELNAKVKF
jgi:predicted transcriptional regulator